MATTANEQSHEKTLTALMQELGLSWRDMGLAAWYPNPCITRIPTGRETQWAYEASGAVGSILGRSATAAADSLRAIAARKGDGGWLPYLETYHKDNYR